MLKKISKIGGIILAILFILIFLIFAGLNIMQYTYYGDYQNVKTDIQPSYGLNVGHPYAQQGIEYIKEIDRYIITAYTSDKDKASKIYVSENKGVDILNNDGTLFQGHVGGIAVHTGTRSILITCTNGLAILDLDELINNIDNVDTIKIKYVRELFFDPSFVFVEGDTIWVGEFYNGVEYEGSGFNATYKGEESHAILTTINIDDLINNDIVYDKYYAIPNKVQGVAVSNGYIYLSTSYGLSDSHILTYKINNFPISEYSSLENEVLFLDSNSKIGDLTAPWMSEDLTIADDMLVTHFESASNKYIIGKLYFANYIVGLDILV